MTPMYIGTSLRSALFDGLGILFYNNFIERTPEKIRVVLFNSQNQYLHEQSVLDGW
jgi:hypothetical protein